jgi:hypothetical protein
MDYIIQKEKRDRAGRRISQLLLKEKRHDDVAAFCPEV